MNGVQIEYLLGLYFLVVSLSWEGGRVSADAVKLAFAALFLILAFLRISLIN